MSAQTSQTEQRIKPAPPPRPDHFLALRVSHHAHVTSTIRDVQYSIAVHSPHLEPAFVDPGSAHITLGVLSLRDEASLQAAREILATAAATALKEIDPPPPAVTLEGLSNFRDQVLFLDMRRDDSSERFFQFVSTVRAHFQEAGLLVQAERPFVPHVTIAKVSKMQPWSGSHRGRRNKYSSKSKRSSWKQGNSSESNAMPQEDTSNYVDAIAMKSSAPEEGQNIFEIKERGEDVGEATAKKKRWPTTPLSIPLEAYAEHVNVHAGLVGVEEIQVCAMQGREHGEEYYPVIATARLLV